MRFITELAIKNIKGRGRRSSALVLLTALLSASLFGGTVTVRSLQNGLRSYEARLGADIIVTPWEAVKEGKLESILIQGAPGYFYMEDSLLEEIRQIEGVDAISPQFYLSSASSGCCDTLVQIIGFDPDTDFSVQPWIRESYSQSLGDGDVIVGWNIRVPENRHFRFYNVDCTVVARLDKTGTGLDSAIYANMNTIKQMMESADDIGFTYFKDVDVKKAVSSILVNVKEGYDTGKIVSEINRLSKDVSATSTKDMVSSVADGLSGISKLVGILIVFTWILGTAILVVSFAMMVNERVSELAVLRNIGGTKAMLSGILIAEAVIVSFTGGAVGTALTGLVIISFADTLKNSIGLPLLLSGSGYITIMVICSILVSVAVCAVTSSVCAFRITSKDTGLILREGK